MESFSFEYWFPFIAGYGFALIVGDILTGCVVDALRKRIPWRTPPKTPSSAFFARILGYVERFLYVTALYFGNWQFIAFWLVLKVGGQWKRWQEGVKDGDQEIPGRTFLNIYLIGSGLSVAFATVGWKIIQFLWRKNWGPRAGVLAVVFFVGVLALWGLAACLGKKPAAPDKTA